MPAYIHFFIISIPLSGAEMAYVGLFNNMFLIYVQYRQPTNITQLTMFWCTLIKAN